MKILIINGPNLNLLGQRNTEIYGDSSFEDYLQKLQSDFKEHDISYFQSNNEGELVNKLQEAAHDIAGVILNPGGYTHTSVAIADAVEAIQVPVTEVHISNIQSREDFRQESLISPVASGVIAGLGLAGYALAIEGVIMESTS